MSKKENKKGDHTGEPIYKCDCNAKTFSDIRKRNCYKKLKQLTLH